MRYQFIVLETRPKLLVTRSSSAILKNAGVNIVALDSVMAFRLSMLEFRDLLVNLVLFWTLISSQTPLYKMANVSTAGATVGLLGAGWPWLDGDVFNG